jgi:hypothetical protein
VTTLIAQAILFFSQGDEANFFRSIKDIPFLSEPNGRGDSIFIECEERHISCEEFLTLYSVFKRYNVDCKQLNAIVEHMDDSDVEYIKSPDMMWHHDIFC